MREHTVALEAMPVWNQVPKGMFSKGYGGFLHRDQIYMEIQMYDSGRELPFINKCITPPGVIGDFNFSPNLSFLFTVFPQKVPFAF